MTMAFLPVFWKAYLPSGAPDCQLLNETRKMYLLRLEPVRSTAPALVMMVGSLASSMKSRSASALLLRMPTLSVPPELAAAGAAVGAAAPEVGADVGPAEGEEPGPQAASRAA